MDKYKISQTPGGKKSASKKKAKAVTRKNSSNTDPKLLVIAIVAMIAAIVMGGVVYARYIGHKDDPADTSAAQAQKRAAEQGVVATEVFDGVTTAISGKKPSDLSKYYAKNVQIRILSKSINQKVGKGQVGSFVDNPLNTAQTPWNWQVPAQLLSAWQQGPYGEYFIGNVIVGISADNTVIAIHIDENGQIDSIFIAPVGDLTTPPANTPAPSNPATNPDPQAPATSGPASTEDSD